MAIREEKARPMSGLSMATKKTARLSRGRWYKSRSTTNYVVVGGGMM